ncbi:MAG: hypothetical protein CMK23_05285 [Porticoccaceae bacterium]|nr:hypothetical protein [Porticoccaceae bacterium]|tara:strand:- start:3759 stop:4100 length:342 start_codon:yes stop_codon:yes gene_type:complete
MAESGLGDGTGGKPAKVQVIDPMSIKSPAKAAAQKTTSYMQAQASGSSGAKTLSNKGDSEAVSSAKDAMLPRQEEEAVAGVVNGVGAFIDGYKRINKRRYTARGSRPSLLGQK